MLNSLVGIYGNGVMAGDYESISTVNGTGSAATVTLSSIPATFQHLQLRCTVLTGTAGGGLSLNLNSDSGANYASHRLYGDGSSAQAGAQTSLTYLQFFGFTNSTATTSPTNFIIDILDYANTSKFKTVRISLGTDRNGSGEVGIFSGLWQSTAAVNTIAINCGQNYTTTSQFALYGIKG